MSDHYMAAHLNKSSKSKSSYYHDMNNSSLYGANLGHVFADGPPPLDDTVEEDEKDIAFGDNQVKLAANPSNSTQPNYGHDSLEVQSTGVFSSQNSDSQNNGFGQTDQEDDGFGDFEGFADFSAAFSHSNDDKGNSWGQTLNEASVQTESEEKTTTHLPTKPTTPGNNVALPKETSKSRRNASFGCFSDSDDDFDDFESSQTLETRKEMSEQRESDTSCKHDNYDEVIADKSMDEPYKQPSIGVNDSIALHHDEFDNFEIAGNHRGSENEIQVEPENDEKYANNISHNKVVDRLPSDMVPNGHDSIQPSLINHPSKQVDNTMDTSVQHTGNQDTEQIYSPADNIRTIENTSSENDKVNLSASIDARGGDIKEFGAFDSGLGDGKVPDESFDKFNSSTADGKIWDDEMDEISDSSLGGNTEEHYSMEDVNHQEASKPAEIETDSIELRNKELTKTPLDSDQFVKSKDNNTMSDDDGFGGFQDSTAVSSRKGDHIEHETPGNGDKFADFHSSEIISPETNKPNLLEITVASTFNHPDEISNPPLPQNDDTPIIIDETSHAFALDERTDTTSTDEFGDFSNFEPTAVKCSPDNEDDFGDFNNFESKADDGGGFGDFSNFDSSSKSSPSEEIDEWGTFSTTTPANGKATSTIASSFGEKRKPEDAFRDFESTATSEDGDGFADFSSVDTNSDFANLSSEKTNPDIQSWTTKSGWHSGSDSKQDWPVSTRTPGHLTLPVPTQPDAKLLNVSVFKPHYNNMISQVTGPVVTCFSWSEVFPGRQAIVELLQTAVQANTESSWKELSGSEKDGSLRFDWVLSSHQSKLLEALTMLPVRLQTTASFHSSNKTSFPLFAASMGLLEPTKGTTTVFQPTTQDINPSSPTPYGVLADVAIPNFTPGNGLMKATLSKSSASLDGKDNSSDTTSESSSLDLDFMAPIGATADSKTESRGLYEDDLLGLSLERNSSDSNNSSSSPALLAGGDAQKVFKFGNVMIPLNTDQGNRDLSEPAKKIVDNFEDLSFMLSKVLMFPLKSK